GVGHGTGHPRRRHRYRLGCGAGDGAGLRCGTGRERGDPRGRAGPDGVGDAAGRRGGPAGVHRGPDTAPALRAGVHCGRRTGAVVTVLVLTDRRQAARPLTEVVSAAVDGGARSVVLREKDLPRSSRLALAPALGVPGLAQLVARTGKPLLALGGVTSPADAAACVAAGAAGVAVMGAVMRARDPAELVAGLVAA